jgi:hypothetical protein
MHVEVGRRRAISARHERRIRWRRIAPLQTTACVPAVSRAGAGGAVAGKFDELFSTVTGDDELDQRIARAKADQTYLSMVLDDPEVPLHNNPAELDARTRVRMRVVSYDGSRFFVEASLTTPVY